MTFWQNKPRKPMKRSPMRKRPDPEPLNEGDFILETGEGRLWRWPRAHMSEKDWQGTVEDWAYHGDSTAQIWHCNQAMRSKKGWFDLASLQPKRGVAILAELKVRDRKGGANTPSKEQWGFIYAGVACGWDVRVWTFPDNAFEAWEALTGLTRHESPYWAETKPVLS